MPLTIKRTNSTSIAANSVLFNGSNQYLTATRSGGWLTYANNFTLDGISGIKIYNKLHINTDFLPSNYSKTLDIIVTGVNHSLQNNDWETKIEAMVIPKTNTPGSANISNAVILDSKANTSFCFSNS